GSVELEVAGGQILGIPALDVAHRVGDDHGDIEHRPGGPYVRLDVILVATLSENRGHCLRPREVAGTEQHNHPLAAALEQGHLAEFRKIVDARMGARIGCEYEPLLQENAYAISHDG